MRSSVLKLVLACLILAGMSEARAGVVLRVFYEDIPGTALSDLIEDPSFPYGTDDSGRGNSGLLLYSEIIQGPFDVVDPEDPDVEIYQNYGTFTRGYIEVPESGAYSFFVASDDASEFRLSTDHDPDNVTHVAMETGCCTTLFAGARVDARSVGPIELEKNKRYYFEHLHKEGAGGNWVQLGWEKPDGTQQFIPGHHLIAFPVSPSNYAPAPDTAPAFLTSYGADANGAPWNVQNTHPADTTADEGGQAIFSVAAQASEPATYQWFKDDVAIDGEMGASLVLDEISLDDDGTEYHVTIANDHGATITSDAGILTVDPDSTAPSVVVAGSRGNPSGLRVVFSEPVTEDSAENLDNYTFDGGTVQSAELSSDGLAVNLTLDATLVEGTEYTFSIANIADRSAAGNVITPSPTEVTFTHGAEFPTARITYARYEDIGGTAVADLTGAAIFPDDPTFVDHPAAWEGPVNVLDNYGTKMFGVLVPETTGTYQFAIAADDNAELYLSIDQNPANKELIASEASWSTSRSYLATPEQLSAEIELEAGKRYYLESLQKEGGGGDNIEVTWRKPGDGAIANAQDPIPESFFIETRSFGDFIFENLGDVAVTSGPDDLTVEETFRATFTMIVDGTPPYTFQWHKDDAPIPGATGPSYTTPEAARTDNGSEYHVVVNNEFSTTTSDKATLTVLFDDIAPSLVSANTTPLNQVVNVVFDERVTTESAQDTANYTLDPAVGIQSATLQADMQTVTLVTDGLATGQAYTLTATGITDLSATGNVIGDNNMDSFNAFAPSKGFVTFELWANAGVGNTAVAGLTGDNRYPDRPDEVRLGTAFSSLTVPGFGAADNLDHFGAKMSGILVPPLTGQYRLFLRSDDASQVWMSEDTDPANATMIMEQTGCCNNMTLADGTLSYLVELEAGQEYYFYGLYKEAGGGDYLTVAWRIPGEDLDSPPGDTDGIPGVYFQGMVDPSESEVTITQHPQSQDVFANQDVTLSVEATGTSLYGGALSYQWMRDGEPILGVTDDSYTFRASLDDDGAVYTVQVLVAGASAISDPATLSVAEDNVDPSITSVETDDTFSQFVVHFDGPVQAPLIEDVTVMSDDGSETLTVNEVTLAADDRSAVITTSPTTPAVRYQVRINPLIDLSQNEADATGFITAWVRQSGGLTRKFYQHTNGSWVAEVYDANQFDLPEPTSTSIVNIFESPRNGGDPPANYGAVLQGWLTAPETGNYVFYMSSDDHGRLYLSETESRADLGFPIAEEPTWNGYREWTDPANPDSRTEADPENRSFVIAMDAGDTFYVEAVFNEGTGGDGLEVTWQLPSDSGPPANGHPSIAGEHLSTYFPVPEDLIISGITPVNNSETSATPTITATITAGGKALDDDSVELRLNGELVQHTLDFTPQEAPFKGISAISYTVPSEDAFGFEENVNVELTYEDELGVEYSESWSFTTLWPIGTVFIEAEDYNYDGGQWVADANGGPTGAAYTGGAYLHLEPVDQVDYNDNDSGGGDGPEYRLEGVTTDNPGLATVGFLEAEDAARSNFSVTSNWKIGWTGPGEWMNYTRDFGTPAREFDVYARIARGDGNAPSATMSKVTNATATDAEQVKEELGMFSGAPSGVWNTMWTYQLHETGDSSTPKRVTLEGVETLRFTWGATSGDIDYLALIPAGIGPINLSFTSIVDNGDGTITLGWTGDGTLVESATVDGTYTAVDGASGTSHTITVGGAGSMMFYQLQASE